MRTIPTPHASMLLTGIVTVMLLASPSLAVSAGAAATGSVSNAHNPVVGPLNRARVPAGLTLGSASARPSGLPSKAQQIKVLTAALVKMRQNFKKDQTFEPGPVDIFDYNIGALWKQGIDGAGTTVAVIEGWSLPGIGKAVAAEDKVLGLPNPKIETIFPSGNGKLPKKCPPGMVKLGTYGSCPAWGGELELDVLSVHLMAPYAKIVISVTPADSQITDDAASQVAPPEMMEALERISSQHLANVISISDGSGESTYGHGAEEITAQEPGELAAASAGIPVLVGTGDCDLQQALPELNAPCTKVTPGPDTSTFDDSPWVTAMGGTLTNLSAQGKRLGPDPVWNYGPFGAPFGEGAGYSAVFPRPWYQDGVASITGSTMRSVPDISMDSADGTSEAGPLMAGVLALATQLNHGNVGPINPVLYGVLGPAGAADGVLDVVSGNNSVYNSKGKVTIPGFVATTGFDVASGWGTINAAKFVPSLVTATQAASEDAGVRGLAQADLTALRNHSITLSATTIGAGGTSFLLAGDFLPEHPVSLRIDGRLIATIKASDLGTVAYLIDPAKLKLSAGRHSISLGSLLLGEKSSFTTT
jgi:subtilase family serine protease